jgi:hypothetical protein
MKFIIEQRLPFTNRKFYVAWNIGILPVRPERVAGHLNRTLDLHFLPYFDWDRLAYQMLVHETKVLQKEFQLSDFYLFHCADHEDGWNVLTLDKLDFWECFDVIKRSTSDRNYKQGCFYTPSRAWTMRATEKGERDRIEYYGVIPSDYQEREKSRAHAELIELLGAKVNWQGKFDSYHWTDIEEFEGVKLGEIIEVGGVTVEAYNTGSHTTKESLQKELEKK